MSGSANWHCDGSATPQPATKKACMHGLKCHGLKSGRCPFAHPSAGGSGAAATPLPVPKKACMHGLKCHGLKSGRCPFAHPSAGGAAATPQPALSAGAPAWQPPVAQDDLAQEAQVAYAQEDEAQEAYAQELYELAFALEQDDAEYGELDEAFAQMGME